MAIKKSNFAAIEYFQTIEVPNTMLFIVFIYIFFVIESFWVSMTLLVSYSK